AESRARESVHLALHVVIDIIVVADSRDVANRAGVQSYDASAADNLFTAVFRIHAINHQGQPVTGARTAAVAGQQGLKIILVQQADGGIIHLTDNHAVRQLLFATDIQEFLFQFRRRHSLFGSEKQI